MPVSLASSYSMSCRRRFCSSLSCLGLRVTGRADESDGDVEGGRGGGLKCPGAGKKTHSVLDFLFSFPT